MSNVAKLKKKAAELEERRQYDKALAVYEQVLEYIGDSDSELDVSLFNRVGDLTLRQGKVTQAVAYYEKAVDLYTDGGFFNNAIALCNKILRNAPGRASIYYKLGKISARKGFAGDAKVNFLEYADRMQRSGQLEHAFTALKEFADLCPDQDDVRLMLAEQLTRSDRKAEALEQLQILYGRYQAEGRTTEANATLERMRAIDPEIVPQVSHRSTPTKVGDLVFLDLSYDEPSDSDRRRDPRQAGTPLPGPLAINPYASYPTPAGGIDPRLSGEIRVVEPDGPFVSPRESLPDEDIVRGVNRPAMEDLESMAGTHGESEPAESGPAHAPNVHYPAHDLALAGILPELDTPGLQLARDEIEEPTHPLDDDAEMVQEPDSAASGVEERIGGESASDNESSMLTTLEFSIDSLAESDEELPEIEMPEIVRSVSEQFELEARQSGEHLVIVHGSGPGASMDGSTATGAESLRPDTPASEAAGDASPGAAAEPPAVDIPWSLEELNRMVEENPDDLVLRRRLGEVLVEEGNRAGGMLELEQVMAGFESIGQISDALSVAEEIIRLEPNSVRHHQKRVEYSFRNNDQALLVDSYLELADALFRTAQLSKARVVYERVLELSGDNSRAKFAVAALVAAPQANEEELREIEPIPVQPPRPQEQQEATPDDSSFVNLGDLLREDEEPRSTRMVVDEEAPSGDEDADFAEMLDKFKRGLAENVDAEDYESHFDLGVAFREMGLLDEAIAQFQRSLRGTRHRTRTLEALGQCFVERSQFQVATSVLERAVAEGEVGDENLVGVLYLLGYANEAMQKYSEAMEYYQRVFVVDIQFRDVVTRLSALEKMVQ